MTSLAPALISVRDAALQQQLHTRRQRLAQAVATPSRTEHMQRLLDEVDQALARIEQGSYGICETCHEPIEPDWLLVDPYSRNCFAHLSPDEQRALERDLDLAYQVQHGLLPKPGIISPGWSLAFHYEPAGAVSGDYCDIIPQDDGSALFLLGDVSGKGVAASMMMTQLHGIFRSLGAGACRVSDLVTHANRIFCEGVISSFFATLACGRLGPEGTIDCCNAGHCFPLHVHNGSVTALDATNLPLGILNDTQYSGQRVALHPGDSLILYSDGLSETFNPDRQQYGTQRLTQLLLRSGHSSPSSLLNSMLEDVRHFRDGGPRTDDLTIMVLRREA